MFTEDKNERLLLLQSWAIEGKSEISMLGIPGMAPYVNIPDLALIIFLHRTESLDRYEISIFQRVGLMPLLSPI